MNLLDLLNFCGNLLDYDPVNETYREQLVALLNDAQMRVITSKHWSFAQRERNLAVYADVPLTLNFTNGSDTVTSGTPVFTFVADLVKPGSDMELAEIVVSRVSGTVTIEDVYQIRYVSSPTQVYLDRKFTAPTAPYEVKLRRREVYLPSDATNVMSVLDPSVGVPRPSIFLSKFERDEIALDPDLEGVVEAYLPSQSINIPAPQVPKGVTVVGAGAGQGTRTINVYMVNVRGPRSQAYPSYRRDVSNGFESSFSKVESFTLTDTQTLRFTPEALERGTGLYRRYYITCDEAGILAPVRVRNADDEGALPDVGTDTVPPQGGLTLAPDLSLPTLTSQPFHSRSVRYFFGNSAAYRAIQLYPHPAADQQLTVRTMVAPERMQEDQDSPLIPADYAQVIAYAALEALTLKVDNPALAQVYERKMTLMVRGMGARYLAEVPRRIVRGVPTGGYRYGINPFGPLKFS